MKSIHGKEMFNLKALFTSDDSLSGNEEKHAQHLKDIAQKHFGVNPESFKGVPDKRLIAALGHMERSRELSRHKAQSGSLFVAAGLAISLAGGVGFLLAAWGLHHLNDARLCEKAAHQDMKKGLKWMKDPNYS